MWLCDSHTSYLLDYGSYSHTNYFIITTDTISNGGRTESQWSGTRLFPSKFFFLLFKSTNNHKNFYEL
jgi:hypothetical protein